MQVLLSESVVWAPDGLPNKMQVATDVYSANYGCKYGFRDRASIQFQRMSERLVIAKEWYKIVIFRV